MPKYFSYIYSRIHYFQFFDLVLPALYERIPILRTFYRPKYKRAYTFWLRTHILEYRCVQNAQNMGMHSSSERENDGDRAKFQQTHTAFIHFR